MTKTQNQVRYPWRQWLRRGVVLRRGKDFNCQVHSMASQIRNRATLERLAISLSISETVITVNRVRRIK